VRPIQNFRQTSGPDTCLIESSVGMLEKRRLHGYGGKRESGTEQECRFAYRFNLTLITIYLGWRNIFHELSLFKKQTFVAIH